MNGTVAPSARSLAVAATWAWLMPSSLAIFAVKSRAAVGDEMVSDVIVPIFLADLWVWKARILWLLMYLFWVVGILKRGLVVR